ncbi:PDZ domain-containing protein [Aquisalibacillus elongatus]|uniref:PDZ domain-containing protein n=1 Tax=Aquisalibacillus elongatus TaxID=485577 RepID=A0A3N5B9H0_9BACI|nr:PDZ domain-containing protein [Aquisalibacillus elongatus]RPF54376.1 hypothetical protein EDC24_1574 [Aquisalibacillus elongatus]
MGMEWLREIGFGMLWLFAQPLLYLVVAFTFWTGYRRVKKEREMFRHRIFPVGSEWSKTWLKGLLVGVILSAALILSGSMMTYEWILALSAIVFIFMLFNIVKGFSPAYTIGILGLSMWAVMFFDINIPAVLNPVMSVDLVLVSYLLVFLLVGELILISTSKRFLSFPELKKGKRGKFIGRHLNKRLMVIPFLAPVPTGTLQLNMFDWWPVFGINDTFGLMLVPFVLGISQRFQGEFSEVGAKKMAKALSVLIVVLVIGAVGVYFYQSFAPVLIGVAIVGRAMTQALVSIKDVEKAPIFSPQPVGITVVGVMPNSPAADMGIQVGEKIIKIHEEPVSNEHEFFEVMSENRTFCKMSVQDLNGEIRFVQRALYQGEYHELGLVFVKETPKFTLKTEEIS